MLKAATRFLPRVARRRTAVGWARAPVVQVGPVYVNCYVGSRGDIRTRYPFCTGRPLSLLHIAKHPMSLTPPQPPPQWDHSADDILKLTEEAIEHDRTVQDEVGGLDPKECSFHSVSCNAV